LTATFSLFSLWQSKQRRFPFLARRCEYSEVWAVWQVMHSPSLKGPCSTVPPAFNFEASWQLEQSLLPASVVPKGLGSEGGLWHASHSDEATGLWTLVFSSFTCDEEWGLWHLS
jgi:hypothetical protein